MRYRGNKGIRLINIRDTSNYQYNVAVNRIDSSFKEISSSEFMNQLVYI